MKVLYAAYRHAPRDAASQGGADYQFLHALEKSGVDVILAGPFQRDPILPEKIVKKIFGKRYLKYDLTNTLRASKKVAEMVEEEKPDLVFSLYPPPLTFYHREIPYVFRADAVFLGINDEFPEFIGEAGFLRPIRIYLEKLAIKQCALILTHSEWTKHSLEQHYGVASEKVVIFPNPSSLPAKMIGEDISVRETKKLGEEKLQLLFVGRDSYRKGLAIALDVVEGLTIQGVDVVLSICGIEGEDQENVRYYGNLNRSNPEEFELYLKLLRSSHLLLHPARFDPSPRVTSEAAAFGTPTITNDAGGLGTSVRDGVSGVVLPKGAQAEVYTEAILEIINHSEKYYALCRSTKDRYDRKLNWEVTGKKLVKFFLELIDQKNQAV